MKHLLAIRLLSGLAANAAQLVFGLRWITPSTSQWADIDAQYAYAEAHHEFLCIWTPLPDIRGTNFDTWLHAAGTLHVAVEVLIVSALIYLCATWLARRSEAEHPLNAERGSA
jgi:hypothetical protein